MARQESGMWKNTETGGSSPTRKAGKPASDKSGLWEDCCPAADYTRRASGANRPTRGMGEAAGHAVDGRSRIDDAPGVQIGDGDEDDKSSS